MTQGNSLTSFAAKIGVGKRTIYEWIDDHEEFSHAADQAQTACQVYYEKIAMMHATGQIKSKANLEKTPYLKHASEGMLKFMMAARFDDYRPKQKLDHDGAIDFNNLDIEVKVDGLDGTISGNIKHSTSDEEEN